MKKRNRVHRKRSPQLKALDLLSRRTERKRRTWTFERLEDRNVFSATPLDLQFQSFSSATPEGAAAVWAREMAWMMLQSGESTSGTGTSAVLGVDNNAAVLLALPNDPYLNYQWHLINVGQEVGNPDYQEIYGVAGEDINVAPVWNQGITGAGVKVGVLEGGIELNHPDLAANISKTLKYGSNVVSDHATAVAGIIGAVGNNGIGTTGVAGGVTLVPMQLDFSNISSASNVQAFQYAISNGIDIINNSWSPSASRSAVNLSPAMLISSAVPRCSAATAWA